MGSSSPQDIFDLRKIRRLVELMKDHDLTEIELRQGEMEIQLRRGLPGAIPTPTQPPTVSATSATPTGEARVESPAAEDTSNLAIIKSPMVGTFYASSDPDSDPYARVGDMVGPETTVCIVEAMKVFNAIQAEVAGKIVAVLVENGEPVEFGHPLFRVDTGA